jgi:membrane protein YdbS with pleckstrin-like domain
MSNSTVGHNREGAGGGFMQDILSINIKYTLKDLKDFSFAKAGSGSRRAYFIICILLTVLIALGIATILLTFSDAEEMLGFIAIMIVPVFLIWGFALLPAFSTYLILRSSFKKSRLLGTLQCYRLFEDRLEIHSENGSFSLLWNEVYKVQEFKPCFVIQSAPGKFFLVPRRCFESQEPLDLFVNTLNSKIDKKKIKLKRYRLRNSRPDYEEKKFNEDIAGQTAESANERGEPVIEVRFSLFKKDYVAMNFRLYYTRPAGLIFTAIGILLIALSIRNLSLYSIDELIPIAPLLIGVIFTLVMPLTLYSNSVKRYEKDAALQKPYIYKFYEGYFVVEHPTGMNRIQLSDLVKVTEIKTAILLFVTTQIAHIIPKRIFEGREEELKALRDLLKRSASRKASNL